MMSLKMRAIVNKTNKAIYMAKAKTIFGEALKSLNAGEITSEEFLQLDTEFDRAVLNILDCNKIERGLEQERRGLNLINDIVNGEDCKEDCGKDNGLQSVLEEIRREVGL